MNIKHILVATDLTDRSDRAIERALQLQREMEASVTLLHVVERGLPTELTIRHRSDAEALLGARIAAMPQPVRSKCSHSVLVGDAFSIIVREALAQHTHLIAMGEPGKYRYADLFIGTTTDRVVRASSLPVLVVKRSSQGPYGRVLVPFDLSEGATRALETVLTIAPRATVRIVHAWRPPVAALADREAARDAIRKENDETRALIERVAKQAVARTATERTPLSIDMIEDNPYVVLRNESTWPDLMAMGSHARGRLANGMIGNLARHMLAEAPCDVLVAQP
jgi:nucleotide-binding universal stress UspA family protein